MSDQIEEIALTEDREIKIQIHKSQRQLSLWEGNVLLDTFRIALGSQPIGDKKQSGDNKTPEGSYYICTRNNKSRYYLSLGLSYPNCEDAKQAYLEQRIDRNQYNAIVEAIEQGIRPPWDTPLGGEIMIHGNGCSSDWTIGCIAVEDEVMDLLWNYAGLGTKVMIYE